jgi:hypothetical protein
MTTPTEPGWYWIRTLSGEWSTANFDPGRWAKPWDHNSISDVGPRIYAPDESPAAEHTCIRSDKRGLGPCIACGESPAAEPPTDPWCADPADNAREVLALREQLATAERERDALCGRVQRLHKLLAGSHADWADLFGVKEQAEAENARLRAALTPLRNELEMMADNGCPTNWIVRAIDAALTPKDPAL